MNKSKDNRLKNLYPGYFALTMATGILSIALKTHGWVLFSQLLFYLTLLSWLILFKLYSWRLIKYPKVVIDDLLNPKTTFVFFTFVAATNICGLLLYQEGFAIAAEMSWLLAFLYWSALLYFGFAVLCFAHEERKVNVVHGGWLILIVGTQSLVILGSKIASEFGEYGAYMMVEIYMLWALGLIFYGIFVTLFCYRIFFLNMKSEDSSPLMWVIMGASAISANAGSMLLLTDPLIPMLVQLQSVVQMISIMLWTWATWWIPLLVIIGLWKHWYLNIPLGYDPRQWSIVFPLGMYTVATENLALSSEFHPLHFLSVAMLWISIGSWIILMTAMLRHLFRNKNYA